MPNREINQYPESRPFVEQLWTTLHTRAFLFTQPVAIAPAAAAAARQTVAAATAAGGRAGQGPAVVSSYRPPTAPRALLQQQEQQAGPSKQNGSGNGVAQQTRDGKGKPICFDYHSEFQGGGQDPVLTIQTRAFACAVSAAHSNIQTI